MNDPADRHADDRDARARKARYGMRVRGRSVRVLARLAASGAPGPAGKGRRSAGKGRAPASHRAAPISLTRRERR